VAKLPTSKSVPVAVRERYEALKRSYSFPISLKRISGHYYIYKQLISWDREQKKYRCVEMQYLGSISETGEFRARRLKGDDIESARAVIAAHGGSVVMPSPSGLQVSSKPRTTELDRGILTGLTMDGRAPVPALAASLGEEGKRLGYRIRSLEGRLGIEYRPKVIIEGLGYLYFIVFAKFASARPDSDALQRELESNPAVQFAALSPDSKYDMVMVVASISDYNVMGEESLPAILRNIRMGPSLKEIKAEWYVSYFDVIKGFMPLRQLFLEERILKSVWTKRQERKQGSLSRNEYAVLAALNLNGATSFRAVERQNNMADGSAKYSYDRLSERKVLNGVTICMNRIGALYNALLIMEIIDEGAYAATRNEVWGIEITERPDHIANRITMVANMGAPYGALFLVPVFKDGDIEELEREFYSKVKGIRISTMVLTKTLCGTMPYNRFDNTKSIQYERYTASKTQEKR
jgi:DNA-binding Lrp family transcriptional regulator